MSDGARVRARPLTVVPLGDGTAAVLAADTGVAVVLPAGLADALSSCTSFATLGDHAARIAGRTGLPPRAVTADLTALAERGLLIGDRELLAQARANAPRGAASIRTLGIVSRDRPAAITRAVAAYAAAIVGRGVELVVVDSSRSAEGRAAATEALAEAARRHGVEARCCGLAEKEAYARVLAARAEVPVDVARFALLDVDDVGVDVGANRNALLLDAAGAGVLVVDDDTLPWAARSDRKGLALAGDAPAMEVQSFGGWEEATASTSPGPVDVLAIHQRLLGRAIGDVLRDAADHHVELSALPSSLAEAIREGEGHIAITTTGVLGDHGASSPAGILFRRGSDRARVLASETAYEAAIASRQVARVAPVTTIAQGTYLPMASVAFDARELWPPFFPVHRNEDAAYGALLGVAFPRASVAHLPAAIVHRPLPPRTSRRDEIWTSAGQLHFGRLLIRVLHHLSHGATGASARRLESLGRRLAYLGAAPPGELAPILHRIALDDAGGRVREASVLLAAGGPGFWRKDLERRRASMLAAIQDGSALVSVELRAPGVDALTSVARALTRFGALLSAWPRLCHAARALHEDGTRPSRALSRSGSSFASSAVS